MGHLGARDLAVTVPSRTLLEGISLDLRPGEILAFVGPNGAGKTTLLRALGGVVRPARGSVLLDGIPLSTLEPTARARALTLLAGAPPPPGAMSVREVVALGRFPHRAWYDWRRRPDDATATETALSQVGLSDAADRPFESLSSGEAQRAWIALAVAQGVRVMLLDEPTSHLDVRYAHDVLALLRALARAGATVGVVLHDLAQAGAYADRVALLAQGRLVATGSPDDVLRPQSLRDAYGIDFEIVATRAGPRAYPAYL
ncbi:MAG: ABC transporter ATP-binding protein [Candidatus Baltobacteraceae bacterium]